MKRFAFILLALIVSTATLTSTDARASTPNERPLCVVAVGMPRYTVDILANRGTSSVSIECFGDTTGLRRSIPVDLTLCTRTFNKNVRYARSNTPWISHGNICRTVRVESGHSTKSDETRGGTLTLAYSCRSNPSGKKLAVAPIVKSIKLKGNSAPSSTPNQSVPTNQTTCLPGKLLKKSFT